jgi:hypothetical protein
MNLTEKTPAEIDQEWGPLAYARNLAHTRLHQLCRQLESSRHEHLRSLLPAAEAAFTEAAAAMVPYLAEWDARGGWTRGWLCTSSTDPHVHRSQYCSTLRPTSTLALVYAVSGLEEIDVVYYAGNTACTVCYPSAPLTVDLRHPANRAKAMMDLAEAATAARKALPGQEADAARLADVAAYVTEMDHVTLTAWVAGDGERYRYYIGRQFKDKRAVTTAVKRLRKASAEAAQRAEQCRAKIDEAEAAGITDDYQPGIVPRFN